MRLDRHAHREALASKGVRNLALEGGFRCVLLQDAAVGPVVARVRAAVQRASLGTVQRSYNNSMQLSALRAAADAER